MLPLVSNKICFMFKAPSPTVHSTTTHTHLLILVLLVINTIVSMSVLIICLTGNLNTPEETITILKEKLIFLTNLIIETVTKQHNTETKLFLESKE